ncbi:MAG TPA: pitrilysin family protein, partial [Polyangiaceae bacterium]|nr:pitrilysin family protein [Polyangiaceae bacterium]
MNRALRPRVLVAVALSVAACAAPTAPAPVTPGKSGAPAPVEVATAPVGPAAAAAADRETPDAPFRQQAPTAGPEPAFAPPHWKRFKLKNGLDVFLVEFHDLPLIDFNLMIKTGGAANPPDRAGLADLAANMLDEGTKTRSALQIADQIASLGATLSTGGTWDASNVSLSTLTKNLDAALAIFADVVQNPALDPNEFARVRDNLLTAIARRKDSPPTVATLALSRVLYGPKHPYGWPMSGTEGAIKKLTPADLRAFYDANYRPNNAALIVAGDTTEA